MTDRYPPAAQRESLLTFAQALRSASSAFRRDDCGDPHIRGRRGHVSAVPGGFQLYCICETGMAWTWAKKAMPFARLTQDDDREGMLAMSRPPSAGEAAIIRRYLAIRPKPEVSPAQAQRRRQFGQLLAQRMRTRPPGGQNSLGA